MLMRRRAVTEAAAALGLVATLSLAPTVHASAAERPFDLSGAPAQSVALSAHAKKATVNRGGFEATDAEATFIAGRTNEDWAKLVLTYGDFPVTEANTTVLLRWMRQENGPQDWWNRNNPLNLGAGGFGTFPDLITAAHSVADNLNGNAGYSDIVAALHQGDDAGATAYAIWWSPWSGSHYANGTHWSTRPVDIVQAPASAW